MFMVALKAAATQALSGFLGLSGAQLVQFMVSAGSTSPKLGQ